MPAMRSPAGRDLVVLTLVCALVFGWRLGGLGLIDPDEPFYALTASEMLAHHDLVTPRIFGAPQFEKPPLFYWLACASFTVLGRGETAARLPGALAATLLVLVTAAFGRRAFGARAGLLAGLVLATGVLIAVDARLMLTDVVFAVFVCGACLALWRAIEPAATGAGRWLALAAIASALATLTKGPLGLLVPALALAAWRLARGPGPRVGARAWLAAAALWLVIAVPWYAVMVARHGPEYLRAFFLHENLDRLLHAEHPANNRLDYYPAVIVLGSWPWLPALGVTLMRLRRRLAPGGVARFLGLWMLSSLIFFTLAQSKLPTYILFVFVPLALYIGASLDELLRDGFASRAERVVALALATLQAGALVVPLFLPVAAPYAAPALVAAAVLVAALAMLAVRPGRAWIGTSAAATLALVVAATSGAVGAIEPDASVRPAVLAIEHATPPGSPILCSAFLVRGIRYYTGRGDAVLSNRDWPFFTPHAIPIVRGPRGLADFVRRRGATLVVMRAKEWREIERAAPRPIPGARVAIGDKLLVRVGPEALGALE